MSIEYLIAFAFLVVAAVVVLGCLVMACHEARIHRHREEHGLRCLDGRSDRLEIQLNDPRQTRREVRS